MILFYASSYVDSCMIGAKIVRRDFLTFALSKDVNQTMKVDTETSHFQSELRPKLRLSKNYSRPRPLILSLRRH